MAYEDPKTNPLVIVENDKIVLSTEQQKQIIETWNSRPENPPSIAELTKIVWEKEYHPVSTAGVAIRKFLVERSLLSTEKPEKKVIELTDSQKEYIINNARLKPLKLAQLLFNDNNITPLHKEAKVVAEYYNTLDVKVKDEPSGGYTPPKQYQNAAARINKYVYEGTIKPEQWKSNSQIKSYLDSLIKYCHHPRFVLLANRFHDDVERNLFEGSYITYIWDKIDLTPEELDLYIDICQDIVGEYKMNDEIERYTQMLDNTASDAEGKKISLSIGEHIKNLRDDVNKNKTRRKAAVGDLQGKRSDRIQNKRKDNDTLIHLVDFIKQKEGRERLAKTVEAKQKGLIDEVKRLENVDELIFEIYGVGPEEVIYSKV